MNEYTTITAIKQDSDMLYAQVGDAVWVFTNSAYSLMIWYFDVFCQRSIDDYGNYHFQVKLIGDTESNTIVIKDEYLSEWSNEIDLNDLIIFQSSKKVDIDFVINQLQDVEF